MPAAVTPSTTLDNSIQRIGNWTTDTPGDVVSDESRHLARLIWSVSDLLRGDFKTSEYGKIILPFTVLRRLDCVLALGLG